MLPMCVTVENMFDNIKPILKRKPNCIVLHLTSRKILDRLLHLKAAVLDSDENCKVILSQPMTRVDDGEKCLTISKLSDLL